MVKNKYWIVLFSQTGSEIGSLSTKLGIKPDVVLTNNLNQDNWHPFISHCRTITDTHEGLMSFLEDNNEKDTLITLHGYLRLIPSDIVNRYEMYNGHPGLITKYPELKGKDPQEKVAKNLSKYPYIGSVVHRVTPVVDDGEVVSSFSVFNTCNSREEVYKELKRTSLFSWLSFFKEKQGCVSV